MSKQTIRSLTKKGWSQKRIALKLKVRKSKVVAYQRAKGIGLRAKGGAREFWKDVKHEKELHDLSRKEAMKSVKFSSKWYTRRQKRLTGVAKARDTMRKEWYDVKSGKVDLNEMIGRITEDEGLLSEAGYD